GVRAVDRGPRGPRVTDPAAGETPERGHEQHDPPPIRRQVGLAKGASLGGKAGRAESCDPDQGEPVHRVNAPLENQVPEPRDDSDREADEDPPAQCQLVWPGPAGEPRTDTLEAGANRGEGHSSGRI